MPEQYPETYEGYIANEGVFQRVTRPLPSLGDEEVLVAIAAAGVNRADLLQAQGRYPAPPGTTDILGLEAAGIVQHVGANVTHLRPGERVMCLLAGGGYATHCIAHEELCFPLPENLSFVQGAALPEACFALWNSLFFPGWVSPGDVLLIHGGSSGIGTIGCQLARAFGVRVMVTVRTAEKAAVCLALGAESAILYPEESFENKVLGKTQDLGADAILDCVGGAYVARNLSILKPGGRLIQIGCQEGANATVPLITLMQNQLIFVGATLRNQPLDHKVALAKTLYPLLNRLLTAGQLKPVIAKTFSFQHIEDAHIFMKSKKHIGKISLLLS